MELPSHASDTSCFDRLLGIPIAIAYLDAKHAPRETFISRPGQPDQKRVYVFRSDTHDGWYPAPKNPGREFTDDFLLTLSTLRALDESHGYQAQTLTKHFLQAKQDYPYGFGVTIKTVLDTAKTGTPAHHASKEYWKKNPEKASNGSLMRCAPIAMLDRSDMDALIKDTIDATALTHYHPQCVQSCIFYNSMVAALLQSQTKHDSYKKASQTLTYSLPTLSKLYEEPQKTRIPAKQRPIERITPKPLPPQDNRVSGNVIETLNAALFLFLNTKSFKQADAVLGALEGDVDTVGAVLGGLAGAYYGYTDLPEGKTEILDWNGLPIHDEIVDLTKRLHASTR